MTKKRYYENVDVLRGFAIFLVVLGHAVAKENIVTTESIWGAALYNFIYSFHMPLFFVISGFCYNQHISYKKFLIQKSRYLLVPYFVFSIATLLMQKVLPFFTLVNYSLQDEIQQILFFGGNIWFIYVLFIIMAIFPMVAKIINGRIRKGILALISVMMIYIIVGKNVDLFCISKVTYYFLYFIIGHILRFSKENGKIVEVKERTYVTLAITIALLCVDLGIIYGMRLFVKNFYLGYLCQMASAFVGSLMSYFLICTLREEKIKKILKLFGKYSLQIYLFNGYFIAFSRTLLFSIFHISNPMILAVANFTSGMIFNLGFCYFILKSEVIKFICGKR